MPILIISVFFGVVFGFVYAISLDKLSLKVLTVGDVEQVTKLPVLASIPEYNLQTAANRDVAAMQLSRDLIPVGSRLFTHKVEKALNSDKADHEGLHSILLTSPSSDSGNSFLCDHLARMLAANGSTVALTFTYGEPEPGQIDLDSACSPGFPLQKHLKTDENKVMRLCLAVSPDQLGLYDNPMRLLLESLHRAGARYLLIDATSKRGDTLYLKFVPVVDKVLLVTAYDITSKPALSRMTDLIQRHGGNLVGCLFNRRRNVIPEYLYQRLF